MARQISNEEQKSLSIKIWFYGLIVFMIMAWISLPSIIMIAGGMIPTFVAWVCDRSKEKYSTFCVGALNLSGVFPFLLSLWAENHTINASMEFFGDVFALSVIYGSAGLGWALFLSLPPVVAAFINVMAQTRLKTLRNDQSIILEDWGPEVPGDAEKLNRLNH